MEQWRTVPGYRRRYEVSDLGRVRSLDRWESAGKRIKKRWRAGRILKVSVDKYGYPHVRLYFNSDSLNVTVHKLVLLAFVGPCPAGMQARHYPDGTPTNCNLRNLSWTTASINLNDRVEHKTMYNGQQHHSAKLTVKMVRAIRQIKEWPRGTLIDLARKYGVRTKVIHRARDGQTWKHI